MTCLQCHGDTTPGVYLCAADTELFLTDLRGVPDLVTELGVAIAKQSKLGSSVGSGGSNAPSPINLDALNMRGTLEHLLLSMWLRTGHEPVRKLEPIQAVEGITANLRLLVGHKSVGSYASQLANDVRRALELVDIPKEVLRLGTCGTEDCGTPLTALQGHDLTSCQTCGAEYDVKETRAAQKMDALSYLHYKMGTPAQIGRIFKELGVPVTANTIYQWVFLEHLEAAGKNLQGRDVYRVSDVLEVRKSKRSA